MRPARAASSVAAWLVQYPLITVVCRDRRDLYAEGIRRGAPAAVPVVDRLHLVHHLRHALEALLIDHRAAWQAAAIGTAPALLPLRSPEPVTRLYQGRRQSSTKGQLRTEAARARRHAPRVAAYQAVHTLHAQGTPTAAMARALGISRPPGYTYLRRDPPPRPKRPPWRPSARVLPPSVPSLIRRWRERWAESMPLWREIQARGDMHSARTVCRVITQRRRASEAGLSPEAQASPDTRLQGPSARAVAFALVGPAAKRSREAQVSRDQRCQRDGDITRAHALSHAWLAMVRERRGHALEAWMADAIHSGIEALARFARGLQDDLPAIKAGLTLAQRNGVTEGQMHRLQLVKRQGDGLWRALGDAGDRHGPLPRRPQGGVPLGACPTLAHVSMTRVAPALDLGGSGST
jgi:transposase